MSITLSDLQNPLNYLKQLKLYDTTLTHTAIQNYLNCPRLFLLDKIIKKLDVKLDSEPFEPFVFGSAIHETLEEFFEETSPFEFTPISHFLENLLDKWSRKSVHLSEDYRKKGFLAIKVYYSRLMEMKPFRVIGVEHEEKCELPTGVRIYGVIDRIDEVSRNYLRLIDYKTGQFTPYTELEKSTQYKMYLLMSKYNHSDYKYVTFDYEFVEHGYNTKFWLSKRELDDFEQYITNIFDAMTQDTEFKASSSHACMWCPYKQICPVFQEARMKTKYDFTYMTPDEMIDAYESSKSIADFYYAQNKSLQDYIVKHEDEFKDCKKSVNVVRSKKQSMIEFMTEEYPEYSIGYDNIPKDKLNELSNHRFYKSDRPYIRISK